MADLFRLSASEAAAHIREGELTSEALVRSCLERIHSRESQVKAWIHLDDDFALAQARECDRSASTRGPIHGVPFAAKDIMDTAALPTEYGSPIYKGNRPAADAACVALSRAAGGVLLGKTVTTEFASRVPLGKTTNPHNPQHTPGGSSSGSAAAVADFMVQLAFGTQTVGSVIRPAAFCGCIGYKPSYGEVSTQGVKQNTASFDTVGLFARTVEDLALFRAAVTGFAPKALAKIPINQLKIGFCRLFWDRTEEYTKTFLEEAANALAKAGAKVFDFDLGKPFEHFEAMGRRITDYEFSRGLTWERNHHSNLLSEFQRDKFTGWLNVSYEQYREAEAALGQCRGYLADAMKDIDLLLTPSAPGEAPAGLTSTGDTSFNILSTWTYTPCVTLPVFTGPSGLPVGIQLIGHRNQDHRLLEAAQAVYRVFSKST
jgi:Asp-tRNA(Asn)/Glu-tRNA(Gln) amidotransferase A subunit family amidase